MFSQSESRPMPMHAPVVLSHYEVRPLVEAHQAGREQVEVSPDLGLSRVTVTLTPEGAHFPQGLLLRWEEARTILEHPNLCYRLTPEGIEPLQAFSEVTGRVVQLYPTGTAPTVLLSGIAMHRVQGTDPWRDTREKIRAARPRGRVLDTCMGLGYTAIQAARQAEWVLTVELDPAVLALARANPWSRPLFTATNIARVLGDVHDLVRGFPDATFHVVIHDPPLFSLAGELYGRDFYRELWRVLKPGGRLFHYVGSPQTKMGRNLTRGVVVRLQEAGFRRVKRVPRAFGVVAVKG